VSRSGSWATSRRASWCGSKRGSTESWRRR
jgi:hypothetical protein